MRLLHQRSFSIVIKVQILPKKILRPGKPDDMPKLQNVNFLSSKTEERLDWNKKKKKKKKKVFSSNQQNTYKLRTRTRDKCVSGVGGEWNLSAKSGKFSLQTATSHRQSPAAAAKPRESFHRKSSDLRLNSREIEAAGRALQTAT